MGVCGSCINEPATSTSEVCEDVEVGIAVAQRGGSAQKSQKKKKGRVPRWNKNQQRFCQHNLAVRAQPEHPPLSLQERSSPKQGATYQMRATMTKDVFRASRAGGSLETVCHTLQAPMMTGLSSRSLGDIQPGLSIRAVNEHGKPCWVKSSQLEKRPGGDKDAWERPEGLSNTLLAWWVVRGDVDNANIVWLVQSDDLQLAEALDAEGFDGSLEWLCGADLNTKVKLVRHWTSELRSPDSFDIVVHRSCIYNDVYSQLADIPATDFYKRFVTTIEGETNAEDDFGGVSREIGKLAVTEMFDEKNEWFKLCNTENGSRCYHVFHKHPEEKEAAKRDGHFRFMGRFFGKLMFDDFPVDAHLSRLMFKALVGTPVELDDLSYINHQHWESLNKLPEYSDEEIEEMCLDFTATVTGAIHEKIEVELCEGGADRALTKENVEEYIRLYTVFLEKEGDRERTAFQDGFHEVMPAAWISIFTYQELELVLCGIPKINVDDWMTHTMYSGRFKDKTLDHPVVVFFWEVVSEMDEEKRSKLLQFSTGTASLPIEGFGGLQSRAGARHPFHICGVDPRAFPMPRAHTCFNKIELPDYSSMDELKENLLLVIELEIGFDMDE